MVNLLEACSRPDNEEAQLITLALSDGDTIDEVAVAAVLESEPMVDDELDDVEDVDDAELDDEDDEPEDQPTPARVPAAAKS